MVWLSAPRFPGDVSDITAGSDHASCWLSGESVSEIRDGIDGVAPAKQCGGLEQVFDTMEHVYAGPASLRRPSRHRDALRRRAAQPRRVHRRAGQIADGRNDILVEAAGITAGSWCASPSTHVGHELIAAGMLIMAGGGNGIALNYDELERWTRVGYRAGDEIRQGRAVILAHWLLEGWAVV